MKLSNTQAIVLLVIGLIASAGLILFGIIIST